MSKQINKYIYKFTTENRGNDSFKNYETEIKEQIDCYNITSQKSRIYKHIVVDSIKINDDFIEFEFEIKSDLGDNPTLRPLHELSKNLLKVDGLNKHLAHNRFLRIISSQRCIEKTQEEIDYNNSDLDLIINVVEQLKNNNEEFRAKLKKLINDN